LATPISVPSPNIKEIRERYDLSQSDFADQFGLELRTLQNWEQGRAPSDTPTRVFFKIVETDPEIILNVMSGLSGRRHYVFDYWHDDSLSPFRPFTLMWARFWSFTSQKFENAAVHLTGYLGDRRQKHFK
jgi:putative transcriptional regulator